MRLHLATCAKMPEPDPDEALLVGALQSRGLDARVVAWTDEAVDWRSGAATVIRSTWDYHLHCEAFLAWCARTAAQAPLWNPPRVIQWNAHKTYLRDLHGKGVAIAPTVWIPQGERADLARILQRERWEDVVVKPTVSAGSFATLRALAADLKSAQAHLDAQLERRDMMVQRYQRSVEGHGERSVVWIDGAFTHAVRKTPRFSGEQEQVSGMLPIEDDERALAARVLDVVGRDDLLYARVDVARADDGTPMVMELELIEPSLFLLQSQEALARLADAIERRCR